MPFKPALGESDFRALIESPAGYGYVDKTAFVGQVLADPAQVVLFSRPSRFGKTLNLSTLCYFLERRTEDLSHLFQNLVVWDDAAARTHFQQYPVLFLSFKDIKADTYELTLEAIRSVVQDLYRKHRYLLAGSSLDVGEKHAFEQILKGKASEVQCWFSLKRLSEQLSRHHGQKVVVLIDEYDTPIQSGYLHNFFDKVVQFFRNLFSAALKDNRALFKGVLTGVLRVSRESLFSGLNNVVVRSILTREYATSFGFTEHEVAKITEVNADRLAELRKWYDGYRFGGEILYNPWSILSYLDAGEVRPFWVNTSSNDLIYELLVKRGMGLSAEMELLLGGSALRARIDENISMRDLGQRSDAIWSFLVFAGYLRPEDFNYDAHGAVFASLVPPNIEVMRAFKDVFQTWLCRGLASKRHVEALIRAVLTGDAKQLEELLEQLLLTVMSFQDPGSRQPEKLYQGFILGLLVELDALYEVRSNRESGYGRADVLVRPRQPGQPGVVLELKVLSSRRGETHDQALAAAAAQIREKRYATELRDAGACPVHELAVVFDGKRVWVDRLEAETG